MKNDLKKITAILSALLLAFPLFAISDEQLNKYFYKQERSFTKSYTLDYEEITFFYDENQQNYIWVDNDEAGSSTIDEGRFEIKNGKLHLESKKDRTIEAVLEGIEKDIPYIDYTAKIIIFTEGKKWGDLEAPSPEAGSKVYYHDTEFIKTAFSMITDKVYITYTRPDVNSDYYISNRVYSDSYKDTGSYRIMPGIGLTVAGQYGNWFLILDNFKKVYSSDHYAWILIDNPNMVKHYDTVFSQIEVQKEYSSQFYANVKYLTPLSKAEIDKISNRKGYIPYYCYDCIFPDENYKNKINNLDIKSEKILEDNLRLRSSSDLNSTVVITLKKDSKVKIIEVGNRDVIDNIYSKWVKVEVISGKDRDGNEIKKGIIGWCYGGYLK